MPSRSMALLLPFVLEACVQNARSVLAPSVASPNQALYYGTLSSLPRSTVSALLRTWTQASHSYRAF